MSVLIEAGADSDQARPCTTTVKLTPLILAETRGSTDIVAALLDAGVHYFSGE